jgi:transglutaminase-like putative cysteine protease
VFGNRGCRFVAPEGELRLSNSTLIRDSGEPDKQDFYAREVPVQELPAEALPYLMNSRYCEVDLLSPIAAGIFGGVPRGYGRVQAICDWIHDNLAFGYPFARPTSTSTAYPSNQDRYLEWSVSDRIAVSWAEALHCGLSLHVGTGSKWMS